MRSNTAVKVAPFGRWTLRDKAQRPLPTTLPPMTKPSYLHFVLGAVAGSCCGVWVRAIGGLALNGFADWHHVEYLLLDTLLVPKLIAYALLAFIILGSPVFLWARRNNKLSLLLFASLAALAGWFAAFPDLLIPSWALIYLFAGFVAGSVAYATTWALTFRFKRDAPQVARP